MRKSHRSTLILIFLLALPATARAVDEAGPRGAAKPRPDVLLITVDTLRADAPGFAGNERVATPTLDRLAASGRWFPFAHAHNVVTLPSHANLLTGLYPYQHGVRDNSGFRLPADVATLATVLGGAGYATGAVVAAYPLDSTFGLDRGFDLYDDRYPEGSHPTEFAFPERRGDEVVARALEWWDAHAGGPRFLWVHLFDPHAPYEPPEPFASRHRENPYLGEVAATDAFLAPLVERVTADGAPAALVVLTADHGESLGDHGELTHGLFAYEATLRVPLVLWGAGVDPGVDPRPARHVDLFATVLDAAGLTPPDDGHPRHGRSLLGDAELGDSYFESLSATLNRGWAPLRGVIEDGRKLILLPLPELYHLPDDPAESRNLVREERAEARRLRELVPEASKWPPPEGGAGGAARGEISAEEAARLRALGYLSDAAPGKTRYGPEDDPKNLIQLDRRMHRTIDLYSRGELERAVKLAREIVEERPSMHLGQSLLAQTLLESGRTAEALETMTEALRSGHANEGLKRQLGLTLAEVGRAGEAVALLRPLAEAGSPETRNALAVALSEAGNQDAAAETLRRTLELDPDNPTVHQELALVHLRRDSWAEARDSARRALDLNDRLPRAWNHLGVARYHLEDPAGALEAWQHATDLDPELWDALYNLGTKALDLGRREVAEDALRRFVEGAPEERYRADRTRARVLLRRLERSGG